MTTFVISPEEDDAAGFHRQLRIQLETIGWQLASSYEGADVRIHTLHPRLFTRETTHLLRKTSFNILLRFEPKVVNPLIYSRRIPFMFEAVIDMGKVNQMDDSQLIIRWPYVAWKNPAIPNDISRREIGDVNSVPVLEKRDIDCIMIASKKLPYANESNYGLRASIAKERDKLGVSVFGMKWHDSRKILFRDAIRIFIFFLSQLHLSNPLPLLRGLLAAKRLDISSIEDKFELLLRSKFAIVVENSDEYVSEKIIDALLAGAIPIYKGPSLDQFGIPDDCYLRMPDDYRMIPALIGSLSSQEQVALYEAGREFCNSEELSKNWSPRAVANEIAKHLQEIC